MAKIVASDLSTGESNLWEFTEGEFETGRVQEVVVDTGDEVADHILRRFDPKDLRMFAQEQLAFRLVLQRDAWEMAWRQEKEVPGSTALMNGMPVFVGR